MPPPPPPPPAPAAVSAPPVANTALLQSIQKGAKLKKTVTNDRSAPLVDAKPSKTVESRNGPSSYEPSGAPQLGGLFAGGMPKLKPAGFKPQQPVNHLQPPQPGIKKSASGPIPQEDKKPQERSSVIGRPAPPVPQARQAPPVPQPRQAPPPPARTSVTAPPVQPVQQVPKPVVKPAMNSPQPPRPTIPGRASVSSPRGSIGVGQDSTEFDGRWTWHTDIPPPRSWPSGDEPQRRASRPPPPPPSRSSVAAQNVKRAPPPPPPR